MQSKLVLFDIDETLIHSDGSGRRAIGRAVVDVLGVKPEGIKVSMSGKTDPQILSEIMTACGQPADHFHERQEELFNIYLKVLEREINQSQAYRLHEGVLELLAELDKHPDVYLGILTGNIERGARIKLGRFGLNHYFPIGAYGSDSGNRNDLPAIARQRAELHYKKEFPAKQILVVGDSVHDVTCAKSYGAISIAVNTGVTSRKDLEEREPDFLFPSLSNVPAVLEAILETGAGR
jgi:phosphoglycolate phosphatase-like HAD superfamily hydrolase